ncbi:sigma-70 family RNA polymerase sigma factor [Hamadaea sp. NPDC050747]|uniref:sigma-70 family RNA polymerase sigma factor n=1 Tax=Hamadaea sp. NPDC050747 TaxID=3155789 RepID=UPI0033CD5ACF
MSSTETRPSFESVMKSSVARSWLKGYARKMAPASISPDDLEAEGMYAMWKAYEKADTAKRGSLDSYLIQAAKWHILTVLNRRKWTGQEKTPAPHGINSKGGVIHADQVEQMYPDDVMREWDEVAGTEHGYAVAELDDIRAEVRAAVAELNPNQRDRVFRRFWLDEAVYTSGNWWNDPRWGVRAVLRAKLAHLAPNGTV